MGIHNQKLKSPPVIEAVVDINCDLPPNIEIEGLEQAARDLFRGEYPLFQTRQLFEHTIQAKGDAPPKASLRRDIEGYLFKTADEKQLVQVRAKGFSFNRLAPYSTLDAYLTEIERTWTLYSSIASPVQIRDIRLRYINLFKLPSVSDKVELKDFLKVDVSFPEESGLQLVGFLNRYSAVDPHTRHRAETILTCKQPENNALPIILDITAVNNKQMQPDDWTKILSEIQALRGLKNRVFFNTLTEQCLQRFK